VVNCTPSRGLFDPYALIEGTERFCTSSVDTCFLDFGTGYLRGTELLSTVDAVVDLVIDCLERPTRGLLSRMQKLHGFAGRWAGAELADELMETFDTLHRTLPRAARHHPFFEGVSVRHITRPMLVKPELLAPEEERYFLPHVFNISEEQARQNYMDIHGARTNRLERGDWFWDGALRGALDGLLGVAARLEKLSAAPEGARLAQMALSLRMYVSFVRSSSNFSYAQLFRDRHREELAREPYWWLPADLPPPGDYTQWYEVAHDELQNVEDLIALLRRGGKDIIITAGTDDDEDTFLLGPDILAALERKIELMRRHWNDTDRFVPTPAK
jgi:hypothetical protein